MFYQCPYFVLPHSTSRRHSYWIYQTIWQAKSIIFIMKLYTDHNSSWVKHAIHQKVESLREASLPKLDNKVNNNSLFKTKYAKFFRKWLMFLHFHNQLVYTATPIISTNILSSTSNNFHLPIPSLLFNKIILKIFTNTPCLYTAAIFSLPILYIQPSPQSTPKIFFRSQPFSQFRLRHRTKELWSFARNGTVLISPFFLIVWIEIMGFTIADYLSLRLK